MNRPKTLSSKWSIAAAAVGLIALGIVLFGPLSGQDARVLITQAIDETNLVTLFGNTRPEARVSQNDRGPVPDSFPMTYMELQLKRPLYLQQQFDQFLIEQTTKGSPNYHQWITQEQLGATYGLAQQDIDTLQSWLQSKGFTIDQVLPSRMVIAFTGTAGQVRAAFHTDIHYLDVGGVLHHANMGDEQIPAALAQAVFGIVSLHDFQPHPMAQLVPNDTIASDCTLQPTQPGTCYALVPADFQIIYNIVPVLRAGYTGAGQVIAVVEESDTYNSQADVTTFRNTFLSKYSGTVTTVHPGTGCTDPGVNTADSESDLDAEVVGASAPNATILVAACESTTTTAGVLIAIQNYSSYSTKPNIFSMSYGECEAVNGATANAAYSSAYSSVQASGVAVFVSTGDGGDSQCSQGYTEGYWGIGVSGFASTAYNVAVGGTDFEDTWNLKEAASPNNVALSTYWSSTNRLTEGSAKSYIPEIPWNQSCASYLTTTYEGYTASYGSTGFCNNKNVLNENNGYQYYLGTSAAAGGPSGCFTGVPSSSQTSSSEGAFVSGTCAGNAKPSFQSGIYGNPADGVRDIPDVAMFASSGVWGHFTTICYSDTTNGGAACTGSPSATTWSGFGGTSVATPVMAGVQALINQRYGNQGNPVSIYYSIAKSEYSVTGYGTTNTGCYSISQYSNSRRGIVPACAFYDVTQGDNNVDCESAGFVGASPCYVPSGTNGVTSTTAGVSAAYTSAGGSGYTSAPTCAIGAPPNLNKYLSPSGGTIWAGGSQATCTASLGTGSTAASGTINANGGSCVGAGMTFQLGATTYTWVSGSPGTTANAVEVPTSCSEANIAKNLEAAINATSSQCGSPSSACFGSATVANASATATISSAIITVTAKTTGCNGVAFFSNQSVYTGLVFNLSPSTGYLNGSSSSQVCTISVTAVGSGYTGNPSCTLTGGTGGSGATCSAQVALGTAPSSYQPAFGATPGWDFATGIGTPNVYNLWNNSAW
jgi:subtilase family serine protease